MFRASSRATSKCTQKSTNSIEVRCSGSIVRTQRQGSRNLAVVGPPEACCRSYSPTMIEKPGINTLIPNAKRGLPHNSALTFILPFVSPATEGHQPWTNPLEVFESKIYLTTQPDPHAPKVKWNLQIRIVLFHCRSNEPFLERTDIHLLGHFFGKHPRTTLLSGSQK